MEVPGSQGILPELKAHCMLISMAVKSNGNCYLCGANLGKTAMKNHLFKAHNEGTSGQECRLLKIEGTYNKEYWLFIDVPVEKTLQAVDTFLRKIWLECCGHLSEFYINEPAAMGHYRHHQIKAVLQLGTLTNGDKFSHAYDFGTTTETTITVLGSIRRKSQKEIVRLLARNDPPVFQCADCGKPADNICAICKYESDNPFLCEECSAEHEHEEMLLPVTNSPRMGECGYDGELDTFTFDPASILKH